MNTPPLLLVAVIVLLLLTPMLRLASQAFRGHGNEEKGTFLQLLPLATATLFAAAAAIFLEQSHHVALTGPLLAQPPAAGVGLVIDRAGAVAATLLALIGLLHLVSGRGTTGTLFVAAIELLIATTIGLLFAETLVGLLLFLTLSSASVILRSDVRGREVLTTATSPWRHSAGRGAGELLLWIGLLLLHSHGVDTVTGATTATGGYEVWPLVPSSLVAVGLLVRGGRSVELMRASASVSLPVGARLTGLLQLGRLLLLVRLERWLPPEMHLLLLLIGGVAVLTAILSAMGRGERVGAGFRLGRLQWGLVVALTGSGVPVGAGILAFLYALGVALVPMVRRDPAVSASAQAREGTAAGSAWRRWGAWIENNGAAALFALTGLLLERLARLTLRLDRLVIDRIVEGIGGLVQFAGMTVRQLQSGRVGTYLLLMVVALVLFMFAFV